MLIIGLTGGIGSGKSTVTNLFAQKGAPIIDADDIAHDIVQRGQPALERITNEFGAHYLTSNGELDRDKVRSHIYNHPTDKKRLESILHPLVFNEIQRQLSTVNFPYGILSIPLLFETGFHHHVQRVVVVDCPEEIQIERVNRRDDLPIDDIKKILSSQCSRAYRIEHADDVINNDCSQDKLASQVQRLHDKYLNISTGKSVANPSE